VKRSDDGDSDCGESMAMMNVVVLCDLKGTTAYQHKLLNRAQCRLLSILVGNTSIRSIWYELWSDVYLMK